MYTNINTCEKCNTKNLQLNGPVNRGSVRSRLKQHEIAIDDYDKAVCVNPNLAETYANRGTAKVQLGRIDEARSDFKIALELAEHQKNDDVEDFVEEQLQRLG